MKLILRTRESDYTTNIPAGPWDSVVIEIDGESVKRILVIEKGDHIKQLPPGPWDQVRVRPGAMIDGHDASDIEIREFIIEDDKDEPADQRTVVGAVNFKGTPVKFEATP